MKPERSNYEIWFIDWLDGKLNSQQIGELQLFLQENPDLQQELDAFAAVYLKPYKEIFNGKDAIRRTYNNLTPGQFEHLCIAYYENDLSPAQISELREMLDSDPEKRKSFELMGKLKLIPPDIAFSHKSKLKKLTAEQKIFRLATIGLSIAASVAFIIMVYFVLRPVFNEPQEQIAVDPTADTLLIRTISPVVAANLSITSNSPGRIAEVDAAVIKSGTTDENASISFQTIPSENTDSSSVNGGSVPIEKIMALSSVRVSVPANLSAGSNPASSVLRPRRYENLPPFFDDGRSNVERFLARFFHEKILKNTESGDKPVETFEIAEAGITGLNKLFGWEIALQKNVDEGGEVKSYYFNSKLLKFNAPVKKSGKAL